MQGKKVAAKFAKAAGAAGGAAKGWKIPQQELLHIAERRLDPDGNNKQLGVTLEKSQKNPTHQITLKFPFVSDGNVIANLLQDFHREDVLGWK